MTTSLEKIMTTNKHLLTLQREVTLANHVIDELLKENHELKKTLESLIPLKEVSKIIVHTREKDIE